MELSSPHCAVTLNIRTATTEATDRHSPHGIIVTSLCCYSQHQDSYNRGDRQAQPSWNYRHLTMLLLSTSGQLQQRRQTGTALMELSSPHCAVTLNIRTATTEATDRHSPHGIIVTSLCCYSQHQESQSCGIGDIQAESLQNYCHPTILLLSTPRQLWLQQG